MFDIAGTELFLLIILAIIFVGPKDLPRLLRSIGAFLRKARMAARDFQRSLEDIANEADLKDMEQEIHDRKREGRAAPKKGKKK
ncbi:MAG: twin-arginine translocase subunit TatB [Proteobacteria bacterium]|nr:twin-arginine translocase subunit TatB [Pseudomonadota bacterium]